MKPDRPAFMHVTPDIDADLERMAQEKGIPKLVKTQPPQAGAGEGAQATAVSPAPKAKPTPVPVDVLPRSPQKNINFQGPDYVRTALKIRAAEQGTSLRHVIMTALRRDGIRIEDLDMDEDGRRPRT